jgi:hypothetical protein
MMNVIKSSLVLFGMFIFSGIAAYIYIGNQNSLILKAQDVAPRIIKFNEIDPAAIDDLKQALNSLERISTSDLDARLNDLTRNTTIELHPSKTKIPLFSSLPFFLILSSFVSVSIYLLNKKNNSEENELPLFMTSLNTIEYPVLLVNSGLVIVWQNQKSSLVNYSSLQLEEIFDESFDGSEVAIDSKKYSVLVTELNVKSTKHYLAHLVPKIQISKKFISKDEQNNDVLNIT